MSARDPDFAARVRASFARQSMMTTIGARLARVDHGEVVVEMARAEDLLQQHGFVHGGAVGMIGDSACGYAALSMMAKGVGVLTVEYKINFVAPAAGPLFVATGRVVRSGRSLTVTQGAVEAIDGDSRCTVALLTATMMSVEGRDGVAD
jgi:uncharacterized protein (TIGR00369 family)